jgi:hypothetical protein
MLELCSVRALHIDHRSICLDDPIRDEAAHLHVPDIISLVFLELSASTRY